MIKGIIFDFDGVLINSTLPSIKRHQMVAKKLGLKIPSLKILRSLWGKHWEGLLPELAQDMDWTNTELKLYRELYRKQYYLMKFQPIEGLIKMLLRLRKQQLVLSILSSRDRYSMMIRMKQVNINPQLFAIIQSHDECQFAKPHPGVFNLVLKKYQEMGIKTEKIIYVGDTVKFDFQATKNHNPPVRFVAITSGANTRKDFIRAGLNQKFILKTVLELESLLETLSFKQT